ncbi:MAG: fibronectin type III domain-containing protein [Candidatus Andersenbacteria bacterium]
MSFFRWGRGILHLGISGALIFILSFIPIFPLITPYGLTVLLKTIATTLTTPPPATLLEKSMSAEDSSPSTITTESEEVDGLLERLVEKIEEVVPGPDEDIVNTDSTEVARQTRGSPTGAAEVVLPQFVDQAAIAALPTTTVPADELLNVPTTNIPASEGIKFSLNIDLGSHLLPTEEPTASAPLEQKTSEEILAPLEASEAEPVADPGETPLTGPEPVPEPLADPLPSPTPLEETLEEQAVPRSDTSVSTTEAVPQPSVPASTIEEGSPLSWLFRLFPRLATIARAETIPEESIAPRSDTSVSTTGATPASDESAASANQRPRLAISLTDPTGIPMAITPQVTLQDNRPLITISEPTQNLRPGKYTLTVTIADGDSAQTTTQDFTWGVLALNLNQSTYEPGEVAHISMAVLDDGGHTLCDADLTLTVTAPSGTVTTLSTAEQSIVVFPTCADKNVTDFPDYATTYTPAVPGEYHLALTAVTKNGTRQLQESFTVSRDEPLVTRRQGSMRIFPLADYTMQVRVTAREDFTGTITETVPANFKITAAQVEGTPLMVTTQGERQLLISPELTLQAGQSATLTYTYDAPDISPALHLLGPLTLQGDHELVEGWQEPRSWQIAADAVITWDGGGTDGTCGGGAGDGNKWSCGANWSGDVAPGSTDVATFDGTSTKDATIDAAISVSGIDINTGYTGTITQAASTTVTIGAGNYDQAAGTFTDAGNATTNIDINDTNFTLSGGTFSNTGATSSFTFDRNFTLSGGTFTNTNNTITYDGTGDADDSTITCTGTLDGTLALSALTDGGLVTIASGCTVSLGASPTSTLGLDAVDGLVNNGTITIASGTWTVNSDAADPTNDTPLTNNGTITHSGSGWDLNDVSLTNSSGATITYSGTAITMDRSFNQSGTFDLTGKTVTYDATGDADDSTITCTGTLGGTLVISAVDPGGLVTIASGCTVSLGASPTSTLGRGTTNGLTNNGTITIASGTWTMNSVLTSAANAPLTNNGTITHSGTGWNLNDVSLTNSSGATITYSGTAITMERSFTQSGTFDLTGKTVTFEDTASIDDTTVTCTGSLGGTVAIPKDSGGDFIVASGCSVSLGASPTSTVGRLSGLTNNGTITIASGTWTVNSDAADPTNDTPLTNNGTITHSGSGWDLNDVSLTNSSGATITYSGTALSIERHFTHNGTFDLTGKTITFDGAGDADDATLTCGSTLAGSIVINKTHASGNTTLGSNCTIAGSFTRTDGPVTDPASAFTLTVQGDVSISTTDTFGGANLTLTLGGGNNQTVTQNAGSIAGPFKVDKSGNTASLSTALTTGATCNVVEGTFDINGSAFTCGSTFTVEDGGTLELFGSETPTTPVLNSGSTVKYTGDGLGAGAYTITTLATTYHHLTIAADSTDTFSLGVALDVNGNLTNTSGTLSPGSNTITLAGTWSNSGTFTAGTSTVTLDGSSQTLSGATTFYNLTKSVSATATLTFPASTTQTVTNTLTLNGAASNLLSLRSSTDGTQWRIDPQGTRTISYLDVKDSNNLNATAIACSTGCVSSGNNTNWTISTATRTWDGEGATNDCSEAANWSGDTIPASTEDVVLDATSVKNMTWDASCPATVASFSQNTGYTGIVTINTVYGEVGFTNFTITNNLTINAGTVNHADNSTAETNRLKFTVGGNFTVGASGSLSADILGFNPTQGPGGSGAVNVAGSYGGIGGDSDTTHNTTTYGSITAPTNIGSGGGSNATGGAGGGAVHLTVTGSSTINGTISTNGGAPGGGTRSAGSGGSVYLTSGTISGSGTMRAHGGAGSNTERHGGGGGRVAVVLTNSGADFSSFSGTTTAYGGTTTSIDSRDGAAGTVYRETEPQTTGGGTLTIDNNDLINENRVTTLMPTSVNLNNFASITIQNKGDLGVDSDDTLNFGTATISGEGADNAFITIIDATGITFPNPYTISGYTLNADGVSSVTGNWTIAATGSLSHSDNATTEDFRLNVTLTGDLTIDSGGTVKADSKGYSADNGPGRPTHGSVEGGAHGGVGGDRLADGTTSLTYGSITAPTNLGSGGDNVEGGGAIQLTVTGALANAGTITALGAATTGGTKGSGAGGSVYITTGTISGAGTIQANGGVTGVTNSNSGGGGRVAVILTGSSATFSGYSGSMTAYGGNSNTTNGDGGAGTVYKQTQAEGTNGGTLTIDNNNLTAASTVFTTLDDEDVNSTTVGSLTLANAAKFTIGSDDTLTLGGTGTTITVGSGTTLTNIGTFNISGTTFSNSGTVDFDDSGNTVVYKGDGDAAADTITVTTLATTYHNLTIASTDSVDTYQLGAALTANGNLTVSAGTFTANTHAPTITGTSTFSGGTYQTSTGINTFTGAVTVNGGTFTGSSGTVDLNSNLTLSSGTLTAPSGTFTVAGNWTKSGGTFTSGTNTVTFDGTGAQTLTSGGTDDGSDFHHLTVNKSADTLSLATNALDTDGTLTVTAGTFSPGSLAVTAAGLTINGGTFTGGDAVIDINDGSFTLSSGTFTNSSGGMTIERNLTVSGGTFTNTGKTVTFDGGGGTDSSNITCTGILDGTVAFAKTSGGTATTIASGCTIDLGSSPTLSSQGTITNNGTILVAGTWTQNNTTILTNNGTITHSGTGWDLNDVSLTNSSGATITYSGTAITIEQSFTQSGTFDLTGKTVTFDDTSSGDDTTVTCTGSLGGTVVITKNTTGDFTLASGCSIDLGADPTTTGTLSNTFLNNGTITIPSGTWTINASGWTMTNAGTITHSGSGWDINNASLINNSGATITYSGTTLSIEHSFTHNGTFDLTGKTVTLDGAEDGDDAALTCGSTLAGNVVINKTHASGNTTLGSNCTIAGSFTRTDGPVTDPASAFTLTVQGDVSISTTDTFGGANLTLTLGGGNNQTVTQNAGSIAGPFKVDKSGNTASLSTALTTGATCNVVEGTFDINGSAFTCGSTFTIEDGGTLELFGSETPTTPVLNSGSTVKYTGDGDSATDSYTLKNYSYHHLTIAATDTTQDTFLTGAATPLTVAGNLTLTTGIFDNATNDNAITVTGNVTMDNNTTSMGDATWTVAGNLDINDVSTFNGNVSTVVMTGSSKTITNGSLNDLNNLTIDTGASISLSNTQDFRATVTVNGTLTSAFSIRAQTNSSAFTVGASGQMTGAGTLQCATGECVITNSGIIDIATISTSVNTTINTGQYDSATVSFSGAHPTAQRVVTFAGNVIFTGNVTFSSTGIGGLGIANTTNNPNLEFRGNVAISESSGSVTWSKGTGTITLGGSSGTQTINFLDKAVEDIVVNASGAVKQLTDGVTTDSLTITAGTLDGNSQAFGLVAAGTLSNTGTLLLNGDETITNLTNDTDSGLVMYDGTGSYLTALSMGNSYFNLTFAGSGGIWEPGAAVTVANNLTITAGTFDIDGQNLTVTGTFSNSDTLRLQGDETTVSLTMDTDSGTITYDGSATYAGLKLGNTYHNLTFNGAGEWDLAAALDVNNNLTLTLGTLDLNGFNLTVGGNLSKTSGAISNTSGRTLTLDGSSQSLNAGDITWENVNINGSSGTVSLGSNFSITTALSIIAGKVLDLVSFILTATSAAISNLGTLTEGTGKVVHTSSNFYIADANFDDNPAISLGSESVYVTLTDADENNDGQAADAVVITVSCPTDSESVTIIETGNATGVFRSSSGLPSTLYAGSATNNDGTLTCADGVNITASYTDVQDTADTASDTALATVDTLPTAPSSFTGSAASSTSITWTWTDNSNNEVGFKLYDDNDALVATIATANATSYSETGLTKGTNYTRKVVSYNNAGNSAYSNTASVTTPAEPTAPSNFDGTAASSTSITWTWTDNSTDEVSWLLQNGSGSTIATIASTTVSGTGSTISYTETGLTRATAYTRKVAATNSDGTSTSSNSKEVTTLSSAPNAFSLRSPANGALLNTSLPTLSWHKAIDDDDGVATYSLILRPSSGSAMTLTGIPGSSASASNPLSRTHHTAQYVAQYFLENDGNPTNDYVALTLKDDGSSRLPLADGTYTWFVTAIDNGGNTTTSASRSFTVDTQAPTIGSISFSPPALLRSGTYRLQSGSLAVTIPLTDTQALQEATVTFAQARTLFGLITSYTTLQSSTYALSGTASTIIFSPREVLTAGETYRVSLTVRDTAGNQRLQEVTLVVLTPEEAAREAIIELDAETTPVDTIIERLREALPDAPFSLPALEAQALLRRDREAANLATFWQELLQNPLVAWLVERGSVFERSFVVAIDVVYTWWQLLLEVGTRFAYAAGNWLKDTTLALARGVSYTMSRFTLETTSAQQALRFQIADGLRATGQFFSRVQSGLASLDVVTPVRQFARRQAHLPAGQAGLPTPLVRGGIFLAAGLTEVAQQLGRIDLGASLQHTAQKFATSPNIGQGHREERLTARQEVTHINAQLQTLGNTFRSVWETGKETRVRTGLKNRQALSRSTDNLLGPAARFGERVLLGGRLFYETVFEANTPTQITNLRITSLQPTTAVIEWDTNHLTHSAKVNYGPTTSYGQEVTSSELANHHRIEITNLTPSTTYYFEVMNRNGDYVFDAYYTLTTPPKDAPAPDSAFIPQDILITGGDVVPILAEPHPEAATVLTATPGQRYRALTIQGGWISVLLPTGDQGWVRQEQVELADPAQPSAEAQRSTR